MNERGGGHNGLTPLLIELVEGRLSDEQADQLRRLLREDPATRKFYSRYMTVHALLQWENAPPLVSKDGLAAPPTEAAPAGSPIFGFLGGLTRGGDLLSGASLLTLTFAVVLLASLGVFWAGSHFFANRVAPREQFAEARSAFREPALPRPERPVAVARLTRLSTVQWADPQLALAEWAKLAEGQEINLAAGRAEILFTSGARVILEGPSRFQVLSPMKARLYYGNLTARTADDAKGFALITPTGKIVDLGTEFGLSVRPSGETEVVVFDGTVDFQYWRPADPGWSGQIAPTSANWQLVTGEALRVDTQGVASRIFAIHDQQFPRSAAPGALRRQGPVVIESVTDNIRSSNAMPFYQIVRGGLDEDVRAYVDRKHEWNGVDASGIPSFLRGADYVMPFNQDKFRGKFEMSVRIACPAEVYVFWDERLPVAAWLSERFTNTGLKIGMDEAPWFNINSGAWVDDCVAAVGPGKSIDNLFSIWKLHVPEPATLTFGPLTQLKNRSMYGIAAVRWPPKYAEKSGFSGLSSIDFADFSAQISSSRWGWSPARNPGSQISGSLHLETCTF